MKPAFSDLIYKINHKYSLDMPSVVDTQKFVDDMILMLFPFKGNMNINKREIEKSMERMKLRLKELLISIENVIEDTPENISEKFFEQLYDTYKVLLDDAAVFVKSDPAAACIEEVILCYPGYLCIVVYRLAHILYELRVPVLPRVMSEYVHGKTGIDIHPGAKIGNNFFIDHGTGIVIGETTVIGNNVKLYQGVTLGALYVKKKLKSVKRHPTIEDNVIIYAGSAILGGDTVIGHDTVIGGNVWLTESIISHSFVYRQHKAIIQDNKNLEQKTNFVI